MNSASCRRVDGTSEASCGGGLALLQTAFQSSRADGEDIANQSDADPLFYKSVVDPETGNNNDDNNDNNDDDNADDDNDDNDDADDAAATDDDDNDDNDN